MLYMVNVMTYKKFKEILSRTDYYNDDKHMLDKVLLSLAAKCEQDRDMELKFFGNDSASAKKYQETCDIITEELTRFSKWYNEI